VRVAESQISLAEGYRKQIITKAPGQNRSSCQEVSSRREASQITCGLTRLPEYLTM
jgi:hypothetical protein